MRWITRTPDLAAVERLSRELDLPPLAARLLALRGIEDPETASRFLRPSLDQLHDPFAMAGMEAAVARLHRAIEQRERVLIYGDYDVDGTMAAVVLLTALRTLGASVDVHIPHRLTDGYGMRVPVIERAASEGYRVVVSVDTGVRAHEVVARAAELGVDCIVTDHHLPGSGLPGACAVLNPHRDDCAYPEKNLCGVGVAFKLAQALLGSRVTEGLLRSYLKVVAIGTIADVVPLTGENRVIARFGLEGLRRPSAAGLRALLDVSGLDGDGVSSGDVGFRIAPRLNAAGRMESARDVIDLFMTRDTGEAREIADRLDRLNRERQQVEETILGGIFSLVEERPEITERFSLVFAREGWHRGVIGIVAQRVVERYNRPALVIGIDSGDGVGSGRSIPGFHLLDALSGAHDLFERFGGHAQAAGFTLAAGRIPELETRFERSARAALTPNDLEPVLRVDAEVSLDSLDGELYSALRQLAPHGMGNPTPVLAARELRLAASPRVVKDKHLRLRVAQRKRAFDAIWWGAASEAAALAQGDRVDAAFTIEENIFQDIATLQLVIKDVKRLSAVSDQLPADGSAKADS